MAITTVGTPATYAANTTTTVSLTVPTGVVNGDLLVVFVGSNVASAGTITAPSGWNLIQTVIAATTTRGGIYYRVTSGDVGGTTSYDWGITSGRGVGVMRAYRGVDSINGPIDSDFTAFAASTGTSSGTTVPIPSVTPVTNGAEIVGFAFARITTANTAGTWTPPAGYTEVADLTSPATAGTNGAMAEAVELLQTTAAATGASNATASTTVGAYVSFALALQPTLPTTASGSVALTGAGTGTLKFAVTGSAAVTLTATGTGSTSVQVGTGSLTLTAAATGALQFPVTASAALALTAAPVVNLLPYGSFENVAAPTNGNTDQVFASTVAISTTQAWAGSRSLAITTTTTNALSVVNFGTDGARAEMYAPISPLGTYTASFYVYTSVATYIEVTGLTIKSGYSIVAGHEGTQVLTTPNAWTRCTTTFTAESNAVWVSPRLLIYTTGVPVGTVFYTDGWQVETGSVARAWMPGSAEGGTGSLSFSGAASAALALTAAASPTAPVPSTGTASLTLTAAASTGIPVAATGTATVELLGAGAPYVRPRPPLPPPPHVPVVPVVAPVPRPTSVWAFSTGAWQSLPDNPLPTLTQRTVTFRLGPGAVSEAQFTIDASLEAAGNIDEEISDLWIACNRRVLFRGRVGASADTYDGNTHTVQFSAADYRALLGRRIIYDADTKTWVNTDQSQVAWNVINQTQGKSGGGLGIVRGSGQTSGVNISPVYEAGATIQETIDTQAATTTGYDWDIEPVTGSTQLQFNVYRPRGTDRGVVLYFPGRIEQFTRQVDPAAFANALRATGGDPPSRDVVGITGTGLSYVTVPSTTPDDVGGTLTGDGIPDDTRIISRSGTPPTVLLLSRQATASSSTANLTIQPAVKPIAVTEAGIASDPAGRWDGQFADSDILTGALLQSKADAALAAGQVVTPTWVVTLSPDMWGGPEDIWLGDPVTLSVRSGTRLNVVETLRVQELAVTLDDDSDAATVAITLGAPPPWLKWNYRAVDKRLKKLERR